MEREHLIIIALILVALYMMNNSSSKDKVQAMGPANRIRYVDPLLPVSDVINPFSTSGHIRHRREGFMPVGEIPGKMPERIRHNDKYIGQSQHIKNHIRHNNRNNMFSGMATGSCGYEEPEPFRFTDNCCSTTGNAPGCNGSC